MPSGNMINITAPDSIEFSAYEALPSHPPKGGILLLQEIFGITNHIKEVVQDFASEGFHCIAPSLFDRVQPGVTLPYSAVDEGRSLVAQCKQESLLADMNASIEKLTQSGHVHAIGYCWGGTLAYLAACKLELSSAVSYYGTRTLELLDLQPKCPVQFHFGELDKSLPPESIAKIQAANPNAPAYVYPNAEHGFNCTDRTAFNPEASALAKQRTLEFIQNAV